MNKKPLTKAFVAATVASTGMYFLSQHLNNQYGFDAPGLESLKPAANTFFAAVTGVVSFASVYFWESKDAKEVEETHPEHQPG